MHNNSLETFYNELRFLHNQFKDRVKAIMGWRADSAFYDRVNGRVKCTQAEQAAFNTAKNELQLDLKKDLFPEGEAKRVATAE